MTIAKVELAVTRTLVLALVLCLGARAQAADVFVSAVCGDDATGDGTRAMPYATIDWAQLSARPGDTIVVLPSADIATGCQSLTSYANIRITMDLCIIAEAGPNETRSAGFVINPDLNVTIRGFTITNPAGHGIHVPSHYSATNLRRVIVENCVVHACLNNGIEVARVPLRIRNCVIAGCGQNGFHGTDQTGHAVFIENSIIVNNRLWGAHMGVFGSTGVLVSYCHFSGNLAGDTVVTSVTQPRVEAPTFVDYDPSTPSAGCDFRLTGTYLNRESSKGNSACIYQNPDGTRSTIGAFGGPAALGFYPQSGPQILRVEIEPTADAGRVRVRVLTREP